MTGLRASSLKARHGFGDGEASVPSDLVGDWERLRPRWKQTHGIRVAELTVPGEELGECDGVWTRVQGCAVAVQTADCVPLLLARRDAGAVAAVHAGWRGSLAGIAREIAQVLQNAGEDLTSWRAAIGPSAGGCCYEVSPEIAGDFRHAFGAGVIRGERHLDLWEVNRLQLAQAGISQVEILGVCTICARLSEPRERDGKPWPGRFESHRRDSQKPGFKVGRQFSVIFASPASLEES